MCGIFSAIGRRNVVPLLLEGLRRLEYRGYDSAGLAVINGKLQRVRSAGRVAELKRSARARGLNGEVGIAHTRWATHGVPSESNAHPHVSGGVSVVHNGIVENYEDLGAKLRAEGYAFVSDTDTEAIAHLLELQTRDFVTLLKAADGLPIIIRLLDLPLHEFLPREDDVTDPRVRQRIAELKETNPMLGHRGVRLAVTTPELYKMQIEAIEQARTQVPANVSIMVPQVITTEEALIVKKLLKGSNMKFGVMMETVRACMRAGRIAGEVDFFSFGTNDLTQAVFSFSREDAEKKFLTTYLERGVLQDNPFEILDVKGVGRLMETAIFWARRAKKEIEIGVCGEQGGEPKSVLYLHSIGVDYVSCSPFRIPIAKLVAAQAAIQSKSESARSDNPPE